MDLGGGFHSQSQSQSRMIKIITFSSLSFRSTLISLILVSFWFILPYSVVIPLCSSFFRYHSCHVIRVIRPCSSIFWFIPVFSALFVYHSASFQLVSVYSGSILVHSVSFSCHSGIFRYVPFRSVPVFSNNQYCLLLDSLHYVVCSCHTPPEMVTVSNKTVLNPANS